MTYRNLVATAALLASAPLAAATPADGHLHAIVNVDIIPDDHVAGARLLSDYARRARTDGNLLSMTLIQQAGSNNHFILDETFASKADYDRHVREDYVRAFRAALYPNLGSPWDERLGSDVAP